MTDEDAAYYAKSFSKLERAIVAKANGQTPTLLKSVERTETPSFEARRAAERLEAMNLLAIEQSRLRGKFFYNYVILNERGLKVQALIKSSKAAR